MSVTIPVGAVAVTVGIYRRRKPRVAPISYGRVGSLVEVLKQIEIDESRSYGCQVNALRPGELAGVMRQQRTDMTV